MDDEKKFNLDDLPLALVLLSDALPASVYDPCRGGGVGGQPVPDGLRGGEEKP